MTSLSVLFSIDDLEQAYLWIFDIRKEYSHNSDIWDLRRDWDKVKHGILDSLNDGSYQFDALRRYYFEDKTLSLWSSTDMIALKVITQFLGIFMKDHIPKSCYHVKGHGGLKYAVRQTHESLDQYQYVMRSDIKSYYDSILYDSLMNIIEGYVKDPILLNLTYKALQRTETYGGLFYDYDKKGIPMGSPLSPLLGAIALIPLDLVISKTNDVFYARFMDDWCILTKTKTALRKIVKKTHTILKSLHLDLHPMKTYIGKISHGFNFLAYYMDNKKILPSQRNHTTL
jgi:RNA-directed DNA polymerase